MVPEFVERSATSRCVLEVQPPSEEVLAQGPRLCAAVRTGKAVLRIRRQNGNATLELCAPFHTDPPHPASPSWLASPHRGWPGPASCGSPAPTSSRANCSPLRHFTRSETARLSS